MIKNKLYSLSIFTTIMTVVMIFGISYATKGNGKDTSTLFGAGMLSLMMLIYLATLPSLFKLLSMKKKTNILIAIIAIGFTVFPILPIITMVYLKGGFIENETAKLKGESNG